MRGSFVKKINLHAIQNGLHFSADMGKWLTDIKVSKKVNLNTKAARIIHLFGHSPGLRLIFRIMPRASR